MPENCEWPRDREKAVYNQNMKDFAIDTELLAIRKFLEFVEENYHKSIHDMLQDMYNDYSDEVMHV